MEKTFQQIKVIIQDLFIISLIFYFIYLIINVLTDNFFEYFIDLNIFLNISLILGILYLALQFFGKRL